MLRTLCGHARASYTRPGDPPAPAPLYNSGMSAARLIAEHRAAGRAFLAGDVRSFVRDEGEGDPVVCVHGIPASSFLYRKVLPLLAGAGLRGLSVDLPGFGFAERPRDFPYGIRGHGAWLEQALDALGIDRFHLVVHDYGGPVGFELCARTPERVRSLTVLDTVLDVERFRRLPLLELGLRAGAADLLMWATPGAAWHVAMRRLGVRDPAALTRAESDAWLTLMRGDDHGRAIVRSARGAEATAGMSERLIGAVQALDVPTQLIWASDDPVLPLATMGARASELLGVAPQLVPGRHFLQEESHAAIAEALTRLAATA